MSQYSMPRLKELALGERPQERLEQAGASALSDTELLALLLRSGSRELDVLGLAATLLAQAGSLGGLLQWTEADYRKLPGIGRVKALQLLSVMELARRILVVSGPGDAPLDSAEAVFRYLSPHAAGLQVEKFWILCLNRKNRLLQKVEITSGTATASLVHPRETFREAIRAGATAIIAAHNHPSGDPSPSRADLKATQQLSEASRIVEIDLLDHVILGTKGADPSGYGYYSFREAGIL